MIVTKEIQTVDEQFLALRKPEKSLAQLADDDLEFEGQTAAADFTLRNRTYRKVFAAVVDELIRKQGQYHYKPISNFELAKEILIATSGRQIPPQFANNAISIANHFLRLQALWTQLFDMPKEDLIITSVYRDAAANARTGRGAPNSYHLTANALDIAVRGNTLSSRLMLLCCGALASDSGYHCIYESHVHTDDHPRSRPVIVTNYKTMDIVSHGVKQLEKEVINLKKNIYVHAK